MPGTGSSGAWLPIINQRPVRMLSIKSDSTCRDPSIAAVQKIMNLTRCLATLGGKMDGEDFKIGPYVLETTAFDRNGCVVYELDIEFDIIDCTCYDECRPEDIGEG